MCTRLSTPCYKLSRSLRLRHARSALSDRICVPVCLSTGTPPCRALRTPLAHCSPAGPVGRALPRRPSGADQFRLSTYGSMPAQTLNTHGSRLPTLYGRWAAPAQIFLTIWITSSSCSTCALPTRPGLCLTEVPQTQPYLKSLMRVRWIFVQKSSTVGSATPRRITGAL